MVPHHSLIIDLAVKIQTIQVGVMATIVPPGAFTKDGTVNTSVAVIVTIFGGKWISSVIRKGISSGTLTKRSDNNTVNYIVLVFHMSCSQVFDEAVCCPTKVIICSI